MSPSAPGADGRIASCLCGRLRVRVTGEPASTYVCCCRACQRTTGSAFAYRAKFWNRQILAVEGEQKRWRRIGDSGRWVEHVFCPSCGALVFMEGEGLRDAIVMSVGCLEEPALAAPPASWHWSSLGHGWIAPPQGARVVP